MHNAAIAALGITARYEPFDVSSDDMAKAIAELRQPDVVGANVAMPYKQAVMPWLDDLTDAAKGVGAVNTIFLEAERLVGDNTDGDGFLEGLAELGIVPTGLACVVIGAGGAARAVTRSMLLVGARVAVSNRTMSRARTLVADLGRLGNVTVLVPDRLVGAVAEAGLLVQATPVGMMGAAEGASPLPAGVLPHRGAVVDLVNRPPETPLLASARAAGLQAQNGLPMLVHQGALGFERWFGMRPPLDVMRAAALEVLG